MCEELSYQKQQKLECISLGPRTKGVSNWAECITHLNISSRPKLRSTWAQPDRKSDTQLSLLFEVVVRKYYRGWPESSGCIFSWVFLILDSLSLGLWEGVWFVLNQSACFGALIHCVIIGPGWASQIWEIFKRKCSHLILVTLDNTSAQQPQTAS